ncbi:FAD-dependent oxidoreductase, partial [Pseudoflavonifractor phocaeensis]|uniref:FAD-dependent oxidoreductase n=1 Tax=Pseudoflavonifractor phocaeensis TaxID=1870988 RepID=UPI0023503692
MTADVIVVGGGPAGMMAALTAAERGARVCLMERNQKVGRKLYITGKGRCNVTNDTDVAGVLANLPRNSRFLTSAVTRFPPASVQAFFEKLGVPLKVERGGRVFPVSDKAADVVDALFGALRRARVSLLEDRAEGLVVEEGPVGGVGGVHW